MRRAIELAKRGWGTTHPNPLVGALGTDVRYREYDDTTHATIALRAMPDVQQWLLDVGAGPTTGH
jgi:pyrimidine deaminase RibD-like protein